jgi:hypothetical protein
MALGITHIFISPAENGQALLDELRYAKQPVQRTVQQAVERSR